MKKTIILTLAVLLVIPFVIALDSSNVVFCNNVTPSTDSSNYLYLNLNGRDDFVDDGVIVTSNTTYGWLTAVSNDDFRLSRNYTGHNASGDGIYMLSFDFVYRTTAGANAPILTFLIGESTYLDTFWLQTHEDNWMYYDTEPTYTSVTLKENVWENWTLVINASDWTVDIYHWNNSAGSWGWDLEINDRTRRGALTGLNYLMFYGGSGVGQTFEVDNIRYWNGTSCPAVSGDTTPPTISEINCTSCVTDDTPNAAPYSTDDTTPTFNFTTDEDAWCAISKYDWNYTTMGATRNCTTGEGSTGHICTLTPQDKFTTVGPHNVYISCKDNSGNEGNVSDHSKSNSGALEMEITGPSEAGGDIAIQTGIETSEIWSLNPTVYNNHQVYARNLSNAQFIGTFDRVAVLGSKRWALNYISEGESAITGLFNLTPVLYVLQLQNQTNESIINEVSAFINGTYP